MKTAYFFGYCEDGHPVLLSLKHELDDILNFLERDTHASDMVANNAEDNWTPSSLRAAMHKFRQRDDSLDKEGVEQLALYLDDICFRGGYSIIRKDVTKHF